MKNTALIYYSITKRGLIFTTDIPAAALLFTAFILLIFSALLSSMEAAFSSCSILKITVKNDEGDKNAGRVLKLLNSFDSTLTGILVWINFVNITYETLITVAVASTRGSTATFLSAVVSAIIIAIAGEIIPKMCVTKNPEAFIMRSSVLLCSILKIAQPVTKAFYKTAEFFARSAIKEKSKNLEEDDIEDLTKEATKNGEIEKDTAKLVLEALVALGELHVNAVIRKPRLFYLVCGVVLAHVIEVASENRILRVAHEHVIRRLRKLHHTLRHTTHNKILAVDLQCLLMERYGHGLARVKASLDFFNNRTLVKGKHELLKVHGSHR